METNRRKYSIHDIFLNRNRVRILDFILERKRFRVVEISELTGLTEEEVIGHLRVFCDLNLIIIDKEQDYRRYSIVENSRIVKNISNMRDFLEKDD
jgi:predicted transcriptional regulator